MATLIRATCSDCGDVELGTRDLVVRLCEDTASGTYVFRCPACESPVVRPADRSTIDLLVSSGVRLEVWSMPAELDETRPCGAPFTYDDLIDFHLLLTDRGWFEDLLEAHRRRH
jgi:hypothetical protein